MEMESRLVTATGNLAGEDVLKGQQEGPCGDGNALYPDWISVSVVL